MRVADDPLDTGHDSEFIRSTLGVATGDQDAGGGVFPVDSSNCGTGIAVGFGGYRAGVQDDDVGCGAFRGGGEAAGSEERVEGGAVGLGGAAAEVLDEECCGTIQTSIFAGRCACTIRAYANHDHWRSGG